jgi:hypothetical protein
MESVEHQVRQWLEQVGPFSSSMFTTSHAGPMLSGYASSCPPAYNRGMIQQLFQAAGLFLCALVFSAIAFTALMIGAYVVWFVIHRLNCRDDPNHANRPSDAP